MQAHGQDRVSRVLILCHIIIQGRLSNQDLGEVEMTGSSGRSLQVASHGSDPVHAGATHPSGVKVTADEGEEGEEDGEV